MGAGHTPGPWGYDWKSGDVFYLDGEAMPLVATVNLEAVSNEQALADLYLIAAAPELLAALIEAEDFMAGFEDDVLQRGLSRKMARIRAAISKAKGAA